MSENTAETVAVGAVTQTNLITDAPVKDAPAHVARSGKRQWQPERIVVEYQQKAGGTWLVAKIKIEGHQILKSGELSTSGALDDSWYLVDWHGNPHLNEWSVQGLPGWALDYAQSHRPTL